MCLSWKVSQNRLMESETIDAKIYRKRKYPFNGLVGRERILLPLILSCQCSRIIKSQSCEIL